MYARPSSADASESKPSPISSTASATVLRIAAKNAANHDDAEDAVTRRCLLPPRVRPGRRAPPWRGWPSSLKQEAGPSIARALRPSQRVPARDPTSATGRSIGHIATSAAGPEDVHRTGRARSRGPSKLAALKPAERQTIGLIGPATPMSRSAPAWAGLSPRRTAAPPRGGRLCGRWQADPPDSTNSLLARPGEDPSLR